MRLEDIRAVDHEGARRLAATVVWEGAHRGPGVLWFETDDGWADAFDPAPEVFLTAALPLASGLGEPRLRVAGRVCETLRSNLESASRLLASWYPTCRPVSVEATGGSGPLSTVLEPRAALFLSGGVDSLALLRRNRLEVREGDPRSFRDAIHLFGWHSDDLDGDVPRPERLRLHAEQRARLERLAARTGLTLLGVRTNARTFHPTYLWSRDVAWSAGMVAPAHAFRRRLTGVTLASGGFPGAHPPHGSHPDLDPLWSSAALTVLHGDADRTRFEKLRSLLDWEDALAVLEVCLHHEVPPRGTVNCGRCEKCLRTRLGLAALGALGRAATLGGEDLDPKEVRRMHLSAGLGSVFVDEMTPPLLAAGRGDLVRAVRSAVRRNARREARRRHPWRRLVPW